MMILSLYVAIVRLNCIQLKKAAHLGLVQQLCSYLILLACTLYSDFFSFRAENGYTRVISIWVGCSMRHMFIDSKYYPEISCPVTLIKYMYLSLPYNCFLLLVFCCNCCVLVDEYML